MLKKYAAFTLAEILIVIAIIGVVSALTVPNLAKNTNNKEIVARVKKADANLSDAYGRARAKYGANLDNWFLSDGTSVTNRTKRVGKRMLEFMNVDKDCGLTTAGCFKNANYALLDANASSSSNLDSTSNNYYKAILADGSSVAFYCPVTSATDISNRQNEDTKAAQEAQKKGESVSTDVLVGNTFCIVDVDVDGPNKGFNTAGIDLFQFILDDRVTTGYYKDNVLYSYNGVYKNALRNCQTSIMGCAAWIMNYDNADYLECADKLDPTNPTAPVTSCN